MFYFDTAAGLASSLASFSIATFSQIADRFLFKPAAICLQCRGRSLARKCWLHGSLH
jgi:hypothetical protein